jgi:hypothetical protein
MQTSREDYIQHFSELSDAALMAVPREDLVQVAKDCLDEEIQRRGLNEPDEAPAPSEAAAEPDHTEPQMAVVGEYQDPGEADLARALLRSAGIDAMLLNERLAGILNIPLAPGTYHLLAPVDSEEEALQILASEISEEDLAAQAEAAGEKEETEEEVE